METPWSQLRQRVNKRWSSPRLSQSPSVLLLAGVRLQARLTCRLRLRRRLFLQMLLVVHRVLEVPPRLVQVRHRVPELPPFRSRKPALQHLFLLPLMPLETQVQQRMTLLPLLPPAVHVLLMFSVLLPLPPAVQVLQSYPVLLRHAG